jgi:hypothetical protein
MSAPYHTKSYEPVSNRGAVTPYVPLGGRARLVIACLLIGIIIDAVAVYFLASQLSLISRFFSGQSVAPAELESNDSRVIMIGVIQALIFLITAVTFLIWIYQAHRNLPATGAQNLEYSPGWAVGGFFVPFLNIVRPFQVMREIWKASEPDQEVAGGDYWKNSDTTPALGFWWFVWVGAGLMAVISAAMMRTVESANRFSQLSLAEMVNRLSTATLLRIVSEILSIIAAVLVILLIKGITARQEEKMSRIHAAMPPPQNPPFNYGASRSAAAP